ncbi:MAG: hypothetical protein U0802_24305 [Candidatus Binatia bacterium]
MTFNGPATVTAAAGAGARRDRGDFDAGGVHQLRRRPGCHWLADPDRASTAAAPPAPARR